MTTVLSIPIGVFSLSTNNEYLIVSGVKVGCYKSWFRWEISHWDFVVVKTDLLYFMSIILFNTLLSVVILLLLLSSILGNSQVIYGPWHSSWNGHSRAKNVTILHLWYDKNRGKMSTLLTSCVSNNHWTFYSVSMFHRPWNRRRLT